MNNETTQQSQAAEEKPRIITATGRRKEASARVQVTFGGRGKLLINNREWDEFFTTPLHKLLVIEPLEKAELVNKVDIRAKVHGGGITGQAGAIRLGIARAIVEYNPELKSPFKKAKLLTRDPRAKERKKYGRKGARRRFQWTKR